MNANADGIHFGTGEDMSSGFFDLADPLSPTVINEPEAKWHYAYIEEKRPGALNVWRSSPVVRPASVSWNPHIFSRAVFDGIDEHHARTGKHPTDILLLNELNLDYERGPSLLDHGAFDTNPANWPSLYAQISEFLAGLLPACQERARDRGFDPRFWFPSWAPGHGEFTPEIARIWTPVAALYDCVSLHSYTDADTITADVLWYLRQFPKHPIGLFEWNTINLGKPNSLGRYAEEIRIRSRLQAISRSYSRFSATYFIYAWERDASHEHDIKGNSHRTRIWNGEVEIPYDAWKAGPAHPAPDPEPEPLPPDPPEEPAVPEYPLGIDVSNNQGYINWDEVARSGVQFAIAKITEGVNFRDGWFPAFWPEMKRVGIKRGAYHFARPSRNKASLEAEFFVQSFEALGTQLEPGDVLALDLEDENAFGDLSFWTLEWCTYVEAWAGFKPLIYVSPSYAFERKLKNQPSLAENGLWLASWGVPTPPPAPAPWDLVAIHQTHVAPAGTIAGISGDIDIDRFNGRISDFEKYGKPGSTSEPHPEPLPPSEFEIGPGIAARMLEYGGTPASSEVDGQFWVEAMDTDGRTYRYNKHTNTTYVYLPD